MKRSLFLTACFMMLCSLVFGQNHWTANDALYANNMSVFATVTVGNETAANAEVAAFYDDEVRGVAMTDSNGKVALTIHGSNREQISFKLFYNEKEYASNATIDFEINGILNNAIIDFYEVHWIYEPNYDLHASMTIVGDIHIDGVAQTSDNFELAVFYNDSLRGVARPNNGIVYLYISGYGKETSPFEFRLYNGTRELVADLRDVNVQFRTDSIIGTKENPLWMNFITAPYVAQVGEVRYQSFANAFNAAVENKATITLLENITIDSETYTVADGKAVVLDMNGKTITVTDNKTSNYELFYIYGGMTVTGNGTIELTSANNRGWNAMSAIFHNRGGVLTIENGTYENLGGTDMAWVVDNSGNYFGDATTNINGGTLTSTYTAIRNRMEQNTHGASGEAILNVAGGTIEGTTSAIWAQAASESTTAPATGKINVSGGNVGLINTARSAGAVSMTTVTGGTVAAFKGEAGELKVVAPGTITGTVTIMTAAGVQVPYAITSEGLYVEAVAQIGETNYATLQEAVNVANGSEVKVLTDITLAETVTVAAGKEVTLNLDGKTVSMVYAENATASHTMILNQGNLTIEGNGKLSYKYTGANLGTTYYANTVTTNPGSVLTVKNGTIENLTYDQATIAYAIDGLTNGNGGDVTVNIEGGVITSGRQALRIFANSTTNTGKLNISGGEFTGRVIIVQNASAKANKAALNITGGTFNPNTYKTDVLYVGGSNSATIAIDANVSGGTFKGEITDTHVKGFITGGTYIEDVTEFCAPAYVCEQNTDGTYSVIAGLRGSGTETDPFLIHNLTELEFFRASVNAGETTYNYPGRWVALADNIDMAEANWERGIGDGINATFDGIFDGKGFAIKNLTMNPEADSDGYVCGGLFGYTYGAATIQNLTLENVAIATTDAGHNVGALVGFANNNGGQLTVKNVTVKGDVRIDAPNVDGVGAIVGYSYRSMGTISGCTVDAEDGSYIKGHSFVGGITGYSYSNATIANCSVKNINITATSKDAAAIAGLVCGGNKVSGCTVENVTVAAQANYASVVGAIAANGIIVEDCTAAEPMVGGNYSDSKPVQARIGNKYYATIADAKAVVAEGEVIAVANDFAIEETITIAEGETVVLDLNGKTITGTDNATTSFGLITNRGNLTIQGEGAITLTATNNRGWNAYSSVISNTVGGKLTVKGGTIEHFGGTDMAYGIDNLTNGKNTYAETVIKGGTVKSTYRAVRQFLNGVEAQNILTVNGGTIEGANKSIWMQDPSANANSGKLTVAKEAVLNGDVYLFVTAGSTVWPVEVAIANAALSEGSELLTGNVPATYSVEQVDGIWGVYAAVASVNGVGYTTVTKAINAAQAGETVQLHALTIDEAIAPWAADSQHTSEKSITIVGAKDENGNLLTTLTGGLFLGYNDGTVRDNTITVEDINFVGKGVTVANQKNVVIEGNKFTDINALVSEKHNNSGSAILVIGSDKDKSIVATVENNVIENVTGTKQAGIYMSQVANATVKGNTVTGTTHNAITISAATDATILVENNTLSQWGLSGEGRAIRISGGATVNVNENVMSNANAPEEFVKITGATAVGASKNYWNGVSPLSMFNTDLTIDPVSILENYYTDVEKTNLVELSASVAMIGTKYYHTFAEALAAVKNGETINLITDCAEDVTIKQVANKNFTINGNDKTYTGTINVNGNNKGGGLTGAGLTITNVNFVLNGEWQSGILTQKVTYACNIVVDGCSFTGTDAKQYGIRLRSGYNITVKNATGTKLYDFVYGSENVIGFTAEDVTVTDSNIGFWFPYGNNLNFKDVNLNVTGTGVGIINRNAGKATFENCVIEAKNAVTLSQNENNAIAYTLEFNGENEFTTSEEWLTVTGTNAVLKTVLNDAELDVTETSGLVANIGNVYYNTLQHAINAAQNGDTVLIANDFTLDAKKYETQNDGYATLVNVKEKAVTIDLNGKTVTVETLAADLASAKGAMLLSVFHADTNGQLTLVDSSADGTGTVNVKVNDAKVYSVFASESQYTDKTNSGKLTVNTGNYTTVGKLANAMCFSDADRVITINGGKFVLDGISTGSFYPWFVNTLGNNVLSVVVTGGTFNADINHQYRPYEISIAKELALKDNGNGTWTIASAEAYVTEIVDGYSHNVGYVTLAEAIKAAGKEYGMSGYKKDLSNVVTLLQNVEMASTLPITDKEFTLNGENYTISQAEDCNNTRALFDITRGKATLNKVTFDGIKGGAVVRTVDTEFAMDNVTAQNCEHTQIEGLFRLRGKNTITNSTFKNNTCTMVMTLNFDGENPNLPQVVDNCLFEGNTVNGTAALYYVKGESFALTNSEFVSNTINCNSNGATIYLGFQENCKVTGNLFKNNSVTDASTSTRVAGAIFFGYKANISGNAFDNNTATNADGAVLGQVCTSTYYDCEINLDGNYWNTVAPVYGRDYTVQHQTGEGTFVLDSYYTSYTYENDVLTLGGKATFDYVAEVGKLKYLTLAEAAAVAEGKTVTMLANVELAESIVFTGTTTLDLNGKKITGTDNNTSGNFYLINNNRGELTIVDSSAEQTGAITLTATTERNWSASSVVVANNSGTVTVNGGTIQHLGGTSMAYGIDNLTNGANTVATLNIEGGNVQSTYFAVRQFANGGKNSLNVTGGTVGYAWMQSPNANVNVANISVEDGAVAGICLSGNNADVDLMAKVECVGEVYGTMPAGMVLKEVAGYYTLLPAVAEVDETLYATLQDAVDAADGKTVNVIADIEQNVTTVVTGTVTIALNGFTVTGTPEEAAAYAVINNKGNLTIKGEGSIVCNHTLAGSAGYAVNAITNGGTLTIDGATVENNSTAQYQIGYAIDNNSTTGNAVVVVKSGAVRASVSYYYDGIRQFCNSLTNENSVTIKGGEVSTLWMQNPSDGAEKNTKDVKGSFAIEGGKVGVVSTEPSANFTASITAGEIGRVEYFQTSEGRNLVGYITGGTFGMDVNAFCHANYSAIEQDNGTWIVKQTAGTLTRTLTSGWSWFSSYIDIEGSYGLELLKETLGSSAEQIKEGVSGQGKFLQYSEESGWYGNLTATSSKKMYQIKTTAAVEVSLEGDFFGVENYRPILRTGWNYLSYPHTDTLNTVDALAGFHPVNGDIIKTLGGSLTNFNGTWLGNLTTLNPGEGYMYRNQDVNKEVSYTTSATRSAAKVLVSEAPEHWTADATQYPGNMTMIATLDVEGADYEVAAFVDGEVRGSARPIYVDFLDQYIVVMTINGEDVANVTFKYYDLNAAEVYDLNNVVVYSDNAILGSIESPYALTRGTTGIDESSINSINIYPNPTTTDREINLQATCDKVEVFNTLGVKVAEYQNVDSIDALETAGTYVIRVTLNGDVKHCRLIVK